LAVYEIRCELQRRLLIDSCVDKQRQLPRITQLLKRLEALRDINGPINSADTYCQNTETHCKARILPTNRLGQVSEALPTIAGKVAADQDIGATIVHCFLIPTRMKELISIMFFALI